MSELKLKDVCTFGNGKAHEQYVDEDGKYILITSKFIASDGELYRRTNERLTPLEVGDLCMVMSDVPNGRALAKCFLVDKNNLYTLNQRIGVFRADDRYLKKYFYYLMNRNKYFLLFDDGDSQTNLRKDDILNCPMICPTIEEQEKIVETLDRVSVVINARKREMLYLDNLIKTRFVELFGNPLDVNKVNYVFTDCVEFNPKKSEVKDMQDVEVSFVPMECIGVDGSFSIKGTGLISEYYSGYTYFKDGDVLLAKITPCFENGKVAVATDCMNGIGFGTTEFHVSRPLKGITNSTWIKYLLKNDIVHDLATMNMSGSAGQKRIQTPFFNKLKVYVPPIEEQEAFEAFVHQVDKSKVVVQKALDEARTLFDSLMQEYFG